MDPPSDDAAAAAARPAAALERSAAVLARQLAMAKLTGQPAPAVPTGLLEPLPTLDELLQRKAASARPRLGRNNTVTSASPPVSSGGQLSRPRFRRSNTVSEGRPTPTPTPADRQAIGANLIRKLSARRAAAATPTPTPTPPTPPPPPLNKVETESRSSSEDHAITTTTTTPPTMAVPVGERGAGGGGGGDAAAAFDLPPPLPLAPLPFSHPSPLAPSRTMQTTNKEEEEEGTDRGDPAAAAAADPVVSSSSLRSGSITSTTTTSSTTSSPSPSSSSCTFPRPAAPPRIDQIDPRLVRPLATFGIAAVEGVITGPSSSHHHHRGATDSGGGGLEEDAGGETYRYRERGSSASSSVLKEGQQRHHQLPRTGSISVSSMLSSSSPGGTSEEEEEGGELTTMGGQRRDGGDGNGDGGSFSSSGNSEDPTVSSSRRTRSDRMGSIGPGLEAGAGSGLGAGPGFFDHHHHHHQFTLSSGTEAPREDAAASPVGEEGGAAEEGTTPTLAQTSRLGGKGGGGGAAAAESTPRLPPPAASGSEDPVSEGGLVEWTPRLGPHHHHHHHHHQDQEEEKGSSSVHNTRTPTIVGTETTDAPVLATGTEDEAQDVLPPSSSSSAAAAGSATPPPPPPASASTHSHVAPAASTTTLAGPQQQHPPPSSSKPQGRSLALTLSDYHPFGASSSHPAAAAAAAAAAAGPLASNTNTSGNHHPGVFRSGGGSQTTPLVPDPISPTSVIPNPMEAIEFPRPPLPPSSSSSGQWSTAPPDGRHGSPNNNTPRIEQKAYTTSTDQREVLHVPTPAAAAASHVGGRETLSSSPAGESGRSSRSGVATATVTEEEEGEDARDPAAATSSRDSPNLTSRSAAEIARPALMHTSSAESTASMGVGGGTTTTAGSLPPFEPRVTRLPAAELPANRILAKLDSILGPEPAQKSSSSSTTSSGLLDPPPRKLLLSSPVLQVVNANTVKDRYLLLFTDMLVIAKPLIEDHALTGEPILPDLDGHFLVKSVVECKHLKLSADEDPVEESSSSATAGGKKKHPLLVAFVDRFANDPARAIASLISKGGLAHDGPTIANLLYRNTDLNRNQLGAYLSDRHQRHVLRAYIDRFRFAGVRIDDALRLFLMSVRLPFDGGAAADYVIGVLANMWAEANAATGIDGAVAHGLMTAIMRLSDALHGGDEPGERFFRGSKPPVPPTVDDFIASFRDVDTRSVVPEDLLARIYTAVRRERVENASDNSIFSMTPDIEATIEPAKLPTQLTYRTPSARFTITIPEPDPKFTIKLQGADLQFDPPVLSFARNATQSFRVTGTALGVRTMVLIKRGANAPRYQGLPLNKAFSIERGFMQHTFQLSFTNHLDLKRKYMFSCRDAETRTRWLRLLRERIAVSAKTPIPATPAQAAANAVAVQVLRDAVLAPDEPGVLSAGTPSPRPNVVAPRYGRPVTPSTPRGRLGTPTRPATAGRSNSISRLYPVLYRQEAESGEKRTATTTTAATSGMLTPAASGGGRPATSNSSPDPSTSELSAARLSHGDFVKSGHELVVTTEQNSLLPLVLTFLNAGLEAAPHPLSLRGSAFQLPPLDGSPAPLPSFVSQP